MASPLTLQSKITLSSGHAIPVLGLGVWDSPSDKTTTSCLIALKNGYRHIDTAEVYGNEVQVGAALKQSGLKREEVFITTKIYQPADSPEATREKLLAGIAKSCGQSSSSSSTSPSAASASGDEKGYVDLMLIHNASIGAESYLHIWHEMETLHQQGHIRSIGVSNFGIAALENLRKKARVWPPSVNQLELHPWLQQREIVAYCALHQIHVEAYCPLVRNQKAHDETLVKIAGDKDKTTAQILIRYGLQKGWIPLPKSDDEGRIRQNADVFGWELSEEEMRALDDRPQEEALVLAVDNDKV